MKKPKHCKGCPYYHVAGHPKGSNLRGGKYDHWCSHYGTAAPKAVSICLQQDYRNSDFYKSFVKCIQMYKQKK